MAFWNISFNRFSKEEEEEEGEKEERKKEREKKTGRKVRRVRKVATQLLGRVWGRGSVGVKGGLKLIIGERGRNKRHKHYYC